MEQNLRENSHVTESVTYCLLLFQEEKADITLKYTEASIYTDCT